MSPYTIKIRLIGQFYYRRNSNRIHFSLEEIKFRIMKVYINKYHKQTDILI